ncbi:MAG TPA: flagellar motor stator protein MotA [Syntrophus sp. (in: bacteria)]|jgi:chemotaxis protein MotA|nr:flagellar motor stator protein MotA [Syntrophus sp. (in: bacteria)]
MFVIIGLVIVTACVIGGYLLEHGKMSVLFQPVELLIIGGAALGGFVIASSLKTMKAVVGALLSMFTHKPYGKEEYLDSLRLLNGLFYKIRQQGLVSIESDVDQPEKSPLFNKFPKILHNHRAIGLITDTLRLVMTTTIASHELEALIDTELEGHFEELITPSKMVNFVADSLPGLGIVAAVLGIILTMAKIDSPPSVLGNSIGAALVGTFLGVLLCYGYVGPMAKNLEHAAMEDLQYLVVYKVALVSFVGGAAPKVALEFGRRVIPHESKPGFLEVEESLRAQKK